MTLPLEDEEMVHCLTRLTPKKNFGRILHNLAEKSDFLRDFGRDTIINILQRKVYNSFGISRNEKKLAFLLLGFPKPVPRGVSSFATRNGVDFLEFTLPGQGQGLTPKSRPAGSIGVTRALKFGNGPSQLSSV